MAFDYSKLSDDQLRHISGLDQGARDYLAQKKKDDNTRLQTAGYLRDQTMRGVLDAQTRGTPQAGQTQIATAPQSQFRAGQVAQIGQLQGIANGSQMGAGQMAVRQEGNRALAQQQGMARMQRGANAAIAARGAATNAAQIGLNVAGQAGQAQRQDAQVANQTMAGLLAQGREQDIGLATGQAGLNQGVSLANVQAQLSARGMNDQAALAYMAQLYGVDTTEMQARLQYEQLQAQIRAAQDSRNLTAGDLLQAGGTVGAAYLGRPQVPSGGGK